jgi:branched-chain amino acid aminotransferase
MPYGVKKCIQGLYEGTKAYRTEDGRLLLFRLDQNATRMKMGADRLCMACPSIYQIIDAVKQTALANKRWVMVLPLLLLCC